MSGAAFILAGGRSSRMGRDKALLPFRGRRLIQHVAEQARGVTETITLVGHIDRYANLGYPVIADLIPDRGPLSGIHAALTHTTADWNLILACDMPRITPEFLSKLITRAEASHALAVIPIGPDSIPQPLCAAYHRDCSATIAGALQCNIQKVTTALGPLPIDLWPVPQLLDFRNINTPEEWVSYTHAPR